jgi:hypothetical protein
MNVALALNAFKLAHWIRRPIYDWIEIDVPASEFLPGSGSVAWLVHYPLVLGLLSALTAAFWWTFTLDLNEEQPDSFLAKSAGGGS